MGYVAPVEDGKIVETQTQTSLAKEKKTGNSSLDKEAFLQLLVAQMKYQDPLEPTSNTEYISQFATFSELEQMQNMSSSMELYRASNLVGQTVYVKTTDSAGNPTYTAGKVDYIYYENGKAYLSIDEKLYSMDDLDTVVDADYYEAYNMAYDLAMELNRLPSLKNLTIGEREKVEKIWETFNNMNEYQKTFVASDYQKMIKEYYEQMQLLIKINDAINNAGGGGTTDGDKTEGAGNETDGGTEGGSDSGTEGAGSATETA